MSIYYFIVHNRLFLLQYSTYTVITICVDVLCVYCLFFWWYYKIIKKNCSQVREWRALDSAFDVSEFHLVTNKACLLFWWYYKIIQK